MHASKIGDLPLFATVGAVAAVWLIAVVGFSLTMIGTVLGEMFASQRGLGYLLMNAIGLHNVDIIMSITLMLVVFAAVVSIALLAVDRRLHKRF
jgi:NitT/TauT family transport system permease protein